MELRLTKDQEALRRAVRQFAKKEIAPAVSRMESEGEFPGELIRAMAQSGLMGIPISRELGGAGADFISYIAAIHEISIVSAAVGVILSVHTSVGTLPILQYGTDEQRSVYGRMLASGKGLGAFALTEPHAGSDAASIRTTAVRSGQEYLLNGTKMFISNAGAADTYIAFAVTDPRKGSRGITAFIIDKDTEGLRIGRREKKMGLHGSNTCELIFDQMAVPASRRLGGEGEGFAIAKGTLDGGRIGIAAQALGIAEAALMEAKNWMLPKTALSSPAKQPLGKRQMRQTSDRERLAEMAAQVEAARLLVYRAAWMRQAGMPCTKEASMAKMFASDTAVAVSGEAVRLLGQRGCSKELPAERFYRDAKVTQIYEGTNEIHRIVIGNKLLSE
ncbi:acyl-CoA dehydrogenase family protein [Paenibacillus spongiae]|uniref:Acyl-CoA dehydrogenase family protein n=1 Tax=Paenibacillus spongiae TaxID=2909671 RepID=A0ABY5SJ79_9BACL|nr:acyl-CoA dehydrogenase family protein [Paenibacillus spongiae]UVI32658.1 acyl-CoA dehydrogenase family protein [Paenibacillus spongiae]